VGLVLGKIRTHHRSFQVEILQSISKLVMTSWNHVVKIHVWHFPFHSPFLAKIL